MRDTPQTREYLEEELLPLMEDVMASLLDDPTPLEADNAFSYDMASETRAVAVTVRLLKPYAARIIGKEHATRQALFQIFSAIFKNHGFELHSFNVVGLQEDGTTATTATTTVQSIKDNRWRQQNGPRGSGRWNNQQERRPRVSYRGQERA